MNEHAWPPRKINTLIRCWKLSLTTMIVKMHHFSNDKLLKPVSRVMAETEEEERNSKHNSNNATMDTYCQSPVTTNTQRNNANVTNERQISSDILEETI